MSRPRNRLILLATLAIAFLGTGRARAQFELPEFDISDLDPTNPNGGLRKELRDLDKARLDAMSRTPRAGRDYTKLYMKNDTRERISAALRVIPFEYSDGTTSDLKEYTGGSPWSTLSWYELNPGQKIHVANTNNIIVYTYAKSSSGKVWSGSHGVRVGNNVLQFSQRYIGIGVPEDWTINFTANNSEPPVEIRYTILNGTKQNVRFRLPTGKTYSLNPGQRANYQNRGVASDLKIHVLDTGKTYTLTNGNHKFWWKAKENRVAFDLKYDKD
jgi:hypothetical protein